MTFETPSLGQGKKAPRSITRNRKENNQLPSLSSLQIHTRGKKSMSSVLKRRGVKRVIQIVHRIYRAKHSAEKRLNNKSRH